MGVDYNQKCILGWEFTTEQLEKEISPAEYTQQPRFDTQSGLETHKENVLVKERDYFLELAGFKDECLYELAGAVSDHFGLAMAVDQDDESIFTGISLGDEWDCGRVDLLIGDVQLDLIAKYIDRLKEVQEDLGTPDSPALHFVANVG